MKKFPEVLIIGFRSSGLQETKRTKQELLSTLESRLEIFDLHMWTPGNTGQGLLCVPMNFS